jgi:predicted AlkP superfamily phosphohydrolase/phosphomutase
MGTWLAAAIVLAAHPAVQAPQSAAQSPERLVVISWDGAARWVVDRLMEEGRVPHLARLASNGVAAEYLTPAFPSKTAVTFASIFTGAFPSASGITGNTVPMLPRERHTILQTRSGFDSQALLAEPFYITAARAGRRVVVLSATQAHPSGPHVESLRQSGALERYTQWSGFESRISGSAMWHGHDWVAGDHPEGVILPPHHGTPRGIEIQLPEQRFYALMYDDPRDPAEGYDTVRIYRLGPQSERLFQDLKPRAAADDVEGWSDPFRITQGILFGNLYFRLFSLTPEGGMELYQRSVHSLVGAASPRETEEYVEAYGGFHDDAFREYSRGLFGPTLAQGGEGEAEARILEIVRLDCEFLKRGTRFALQRYRPDLLTHYTPMSDSAGHTWMGVMDPESPAYDGKLAERLWPYYAKVFQLQDEWLGDVVRAAGPGAAVAVVSDHGMAGIDRYFAVNRVLQDAGLLHLSPSADGLLDLTRTKICAPSWGDFFLVVNGTDRRGGIVPPEERDEVLRAAERAFYDARDPETGARIVTKVFRPEEAVGMGLGGPAGGDLYLDFAPGYYPSNRLGTPLVTRAEGGFAAGVHGFWPQRSSMQGIFFLGGSGVPRNGGIPGMRAIDVAPTLMRLMGWPRPPQAQGLQVADAILPR